MSLDECSLSPLFWIFIPLVKTTIVVFVLVMLLIVFFPLFLFSETQRCTSGFKSMELFRVCLLIHQMNCLLGAVFPQKKDMKGRLCAHLVGYVKIFCNT